MSIVSLKNKTILVTGAAGFIGSNLVKRIYQKELDMTATLDAKEAYSDADFVVIAAPTNVYST